MHHLTRLAVSLALLGLGFAAEATGPKVTDKVGYFLCP